MFACRNLRNWSEGLKVKDLGLWGTLLGQVEQAGLSWGAGEAAFRQQGLNRCAGQPYFPGDGFDRHPAAIECDCLFLQLGRPLDGSRQGHGFSLSPAGDAGPLECSDHLAYGGAKLGGDLRDVLGGVFGGEPVRIGETRGDGGGWARARAGAEDAVSLEGAADVRGGEVFGGGDLRDGAAGVEGGQDAVLAEEGFDLGL